MDLNLQCSKCADGLCFLQSVSVLSSVFFSQLRVQLSTSAFVDAFSAVCATAIQPVVLLL